MSFREADDFSQGQICGPFGPKFAGYGDMPPLPLGERLFPWFLRLAPLAIAGALVAAGMVK